MVRYFDSSVILARLLGQKHDPAIAELWRSASERLSSSLLRIECLVGVRRAAAMQSAPVDNRWIRTRVTALDRVFGGLNFKAVDRSIEEIVRKTSALAECRTLDAIHLATALHFRPFVQGALELVTLDRRMKNLARRLGLTVQPPGEP